MAWIKWGLLVVVGVAALFAGYMIYSIGPRNLIGMWRYDQRREGDLKVGDRAADVELVALDGRSTVRLKDSIGPRPLVLIFGSYT